MPITYQRLGNSGGGMVVEISAYPNTQITLSNEKNTYIKTTDGTGKAVFRALKAGTYTAMCTVNGKQFTTQITIVDTLKTGLPSAQIKGLPLKSKIKLSNGIKMILMNKNLSGHPANSATFVSEYIVEEYPWKIERNDCYYWQQSICKHRMGDYYESLTLQEKKAIIQRSMTVKGYYDGYSYGDNPDYDVTETITAHFYIPSATECGSSTYIKDGTNLGFTDDTSRVKTQNRVAKKWVTRTYIDGYYGSGGVYAHCVYYVNEKGVIAQTEYGSEYNSPEYGDHYFGIVPACDISQDAYVALDSDGYYRILGM